MIKRVAVLAAVLISIGAAPAAASRSTTTGGDWPSFTLDASNSRYQASSTVTASNVASLSKVWDLREGESVTGAPVVVAGVVYFGDWGGNVYAVNLADGSIVWQVNVGAAVSSTLLVDSGRVYVGFGPDGPTKVMALDAASGATVWSTTLHGTMGAVWASPTLFDGMIYIGIADAEGVGEGDTSLVGKVFALDASTGTVVWKVATAGTAGGAAVWGSIVADTDPVSGATSIYFGTGNAFGAGTTKWAWSVVSLDAQTGALNWFHQFYDQVFTGGDFDFGSTPNLFTFSVGYVAHRAIGLGSKDGNYYVFDRATGDLLRTYAVSQRGENLGIVGAAGFTVPDFNDPSIFVPGRNLEGGELDAIHPTGDTIAWSTPLAGDVTGSVAIVPGAVFVGDTAGNVYAISTTDGTVLKQLALPTRTSQSGVWGGITVAGGYVLVPSAQGATGTRGLYAYKP